MFARAGPVCISAFAPVGLLVCVSCSCGHGNMACKQVNVGRSGRRSSAGLWPQSKKNGFEVEYRTGPHSVEPLLLCLRVSRPYVGGSVAVAVAPWPWGSLPNSHTPPTVLPTCPLVANGGPVGPRAAAGQQITAGCQHAWSRVAHACLPTSAMAHPSYFTIASVGAGRAQVDTHYFCAWAVTFGANTYSIAPLMFLCGGLFPLLPILCGLPPDRLIFPPTLHSGLKAFSPQSFKDCMDIFSQHDLL
jgi:hypothetical protein